MTALGFIGINDARHRHLVVSLSRIVMVEANGPQGCIMHYDIGRAEPKKILIECSIDWFMQGLIHAVNTAAVLAMQEAMTGEPEQETQQ